MATTPTAGRLGQGTLGDGLPYLRAGTGDPLVYLPGITPHHHVPQGMERRAQMALLKPFLGGRQVWWINRRVGLAAGTTMADLARDYARVLADVFDHPVDVLGISTGGSVALQLAADHPHLVRRLVVVAGAYRLGPGGSRSDGRSRCCGRGGSTRPPRRSWRRWAPGGSASGCSAGSAGYWLRRWSVTATRI